MKRKTVSRSLATLTCGVLAATAVSADGSPYPHDDPVNETAVAYTPHVAVSAATPHPAAYSIAEAGSQMVVGGNFDTVETADRSTDHPRSNVFAFHATDGTISESFRPVLDGDVWSVLSDGTSVWIGGGFTTVNGVTRRAIAKLDLATGQLDTDFTPALSGRVSDMAMHNGVLVIAGTFKRRLMAINPTNGNVSPYIQNVVGGKLPNSNAAQVFKFDISPDQEHLVAVGNFTTVDNQPRPRVFMLDLGLTGSTLSSWNYPPLGVPCTSTRANAIAYVQDVDFAPDSTYFALAAFGYMYQNSNTYPSGRDNQICDSVSPLRDRHPRPVPAEVDQLHRRRLAEVGGRHRGCGVRPGSQPLAGQPVGAGHPRSWLRGPAGRRRGRSRHGPGAGLGPGHAAAVGRLPDRPDRNRRLVRHGRDLLRRQVPPRDQVRRAALIRLIALGRGSRASRLREARRTASSRRDRCRPGPGRRRTPR